MEITCTWLPDWCGYLAIAKAEHFEYSTLLKSREELPRFIEKAEQQHGKSLQKDN